MPVETALWKINGTSLAQVQKGSLESEAALHRWIEADPHLISGDLLIIGSEIVTPFGGRLDLLGIDSDGTVHIIELKRDKTPREVIAQALDYASWVVELESADLDEICSTYLNKDLASAYQQRFGERIPETVNDNHSITIVASSLDPSSERIVQYLSHYHGLDINAAFFTIFDDGTGKHLTRSWLIDPEQVSASVNRSNQKKTAPWTGYYFVNIGVTAEADRSWEDARRYGFVSAGAGTRFRRFMQKLQPGDRVFGYVKGRGYVGYGIVTRAAVMAKDFRLSNGELLLDQKLLGTALKRSVDDEDLAEYVVAVDWKTTVDVDHAKTQAGIFSIQQVVCKIYDSNTVEFLKQQFGVSDQL